MLLKRLGPIDVTGEVVNAIKKFGLLLLTIFSFAIGTAESQTFNPSAPYGTIADTSPKLCAQGGNTFVCSSGLLVTNIAPYVFTQNGAPAVMVQGNYTSTSPPDFTAYGIGTIYYATDTQSLYVDTGSSWIAVGGGGSVTPSSTTTFTYKTVTSAANSLTIDCNISTCENFPGGSPTLPSGTIEGNPTASTAVSQPVFIGANLALTVSSPLIHAGTWAKTGGTTSNTYTFSGVLSNDSLTIAIGCWGGTVPNTCTAPSSFVDSTGQTWTSRGFVVTSNTATVYNVGVALYDLLGTAQAGTHTITVTGTGAYDMQGSEWAGAIVFDQFTSALTGVNAATTSLTVGTLTPAQNNEIAIAWTINGTGGAGTISDPATFTGFTYTSLAYLPGIGGNGISLEASYLTTTATTPAVGATWAYGTSAANAAGLALYEYTQATGILSGTGNATQVNGGALPTTQPCIGTNSSGQLIGCILATNQLTAAGDVLSLANPLVIPGPMSSQSVTVTGDGVHAGMAAILGNTTAPTLPSNTAGFIGPNSASFTSWGCQLPSSSPSGGQVLSCATPNGSGISVGSWASPGGSAITALTGDTTASGTGSVPSTTVSSNGNLFPTPNTVLGDIWYGSGVKTLSALAGNITTTALCLQQTGTGSASAAPQWGACGGGGVSGANPTGTIGLTAVNGSSPNFTRSDGTAPLSQAIVPTWTGLHTFSAGLSCTICTSTTYFLSSATNPEHYWQQTGAGTNLGWWAVGVASGVWSLSTVTDAQAAGQNAMTVTRGTTTNITNISFGNATNNPTYTFLGTGAISGAGINGTVIGASTDFTGPKYILTGSTSCGGSVLMLHAAGSGATAQFDFCFANNTDMDTFSETLADITQATVELPNIPTGSGTSYACAGTSNSITTSTTPCITGAASQLSIPTGTATFAAGSGVTSVVCASGYSCNNTRGTLTIVGGTATTGTIVTVNFSGTLSAAPWCQASMNGGTGFLGIGNSSPTTSAFNITAAITVLGLTFNVNYICQP